MTLETQECGPRIFPSETAIRKVITNADVVPPVFIEERAEVKSCVEVAQRVVLDDEPDTKALRLGNKNVQGVAIPIQNIFHGRCKDRVCRSEERRVGKECRL